MASAGFFEPYRVDKPDKFRLADTDPNDTGKLDSKDGAASRLQQDAARIGELQEVLYAHDRWSLLLIFQAIDAAGKDGTIKHVLAGVDPQGCEVHSFKAPSPIELDHDFLWRCARVLPQRGHIGVFNRSYYEEVLVARVHPELLATQKLPDELVTEHIWEERFEDINAFERHLTRSGVVVLKFFLHVSRAEQRKRLLKRLEDPVRNWKFEAGDIAERGYWDAYMSAYEAMIRATSTAHAPWHVVPADHKWFTRLVVGAAVVDALERLELKYPGLDKDEQTRVAYLRDQLRKQE